MPSHTSDIDAETTFDLLGPKRRRRILEHVAEGPVTVKELSVEIAATEQDVDPDEIDYDDRQPVYVALIQSHLPKLSDHDVVIWDRESGVVTNGSEFQPVFEVLRAAKRSAPSIDA